MMRWKWNKRRYITFLPDMITFFNLFSGFLSILMTARGEIKTAAWLTAMSFIWDSLDGNIARIFKNPNSLGRELDSLADMVSFIVAPAFFAARFLLPHQSSWMFLPLFFYLAAGAYRLARFNIRAPIKQYFEGLPTPAAAIALNMTLLACVKNGWTDPSLFTFVAVAFLMLISFLMVSQVRYPKLSAIRFSKWQLLFYLGFVLYVVAFMNFNAETALASVFLLFVFLAPIYGLPSHLPQHENERSSPQTAR